MMYNYPYTGSFRFYRDPYTPRYLPLPKQNFQKKEPVLEENVFKEEKKEDFSNKEKPIFEILGIKLYFDDILLVCLIWFLYNEGIEDESLFFCLILLLLS